MTAKTVITDEQKPPLSPILYTFKNNIGDVQAVEAHNYRATRHALDKQTGGSKGYRLVERRI